MLINLIQKNKQKYPFESVEKKKKLIIIIEVIEKERLIGKELHELYIENLKIDPMGGSDFSRLFSLIS